MPFSKGDPNINRAGRKPNQELVTNLLREYLSGDYGDGKTRKQKLVEKLFSAAMEGDIHAQKYIIDRVDGKPRESITVDSDSGFEHKIIIERIDRTKPAE